jgi:hypothetical protein
MCLSPVILYVLLLLQCVTSSTGRPGPEQCTVWEPVERQTIPPHYMHRSGHGMTLQLNVCIVYTCHIYKSAAAVCSPGMEGTDRGWLPADPGHPPCPGRRNAFPDSIYSPFYKTILWPCTIALLWARCLIAVWKVASDEPFGCWVAASPARRPW